MTDVTTETARGRAHGPTHVAARIGIVLVGVHGLIHLIGFVVPWRLATLEGFPYTTTAFWDSVDLGATGVRLVGLVWLATAAAFVAGAIGLWRGARWGRAITAGAAIVSIPICLLSSPAATVGLIVDVGILAVLVLERRWVR